MPSKYGTEYKGSSSNNKNNNELYSKTSVPHPPGSGVYMGLEECLMYCVEWKTLKARPARKSREERSPATGRRVNPVVAVH